MAGRRAHRCSGAEHERAVIAGLDPVRPTGRMRCTTPSGAGRKPIAMSISGSRLCMRSASTRRPALGFTVAQDFEGDQFTFFKFPLDDLARALRHRRAGTGSIYDRVEGHVAGADRARPALPGRGRCLLPARHARRRLPPATPRPRSASTASTRGRRCIYFHNAGYFALDGEDYRRPLPRVNEEGGLPLFPYVEFAQVRPDGAGALPARGGAAPARPII